MSAVGGHYAGTVSPEVARISCPFGGGIGGCHEEICGALSGGIIVLGLLWGRQECAEDDTALYELVNELRTRFRAELGDTICDPIRDRFADQPASCRPVVEIASRLLMEIIERERPSRPFTL